MSKNVDLWARNNKKRKALCEKAHELVIRLNDITKELEKLDSHGDLKELKDRFRSLVTNAECNRVSIELRYKSGPSRMNVLNRCAYEWSFLDYWRN